MADTKSWFITGCDKGMGYAFAETILAAGDRVVVTARDKANIAPLLEAYPDSAIGLELDVTRPADIDRAVREAEAWSGGIEILVNNAGYGLLGAVEVVAPEEYRPMFEVNFFGAAQVIQAFLPFMRERRRGHIINVTSIGGFAASAGFGFYAASKFALEGLAEAVALDTANFGIKVTLIEPGSTRTEFAGGSMAWAKRHIPDYDNSPVQTTFDRMKARHGAQPGDPRRIAKILLKLSRLENPPLRFPTGDDGLARMRQKLALTTEEADRFEALSLAVGFESTVDLD